MRRATMAPAPLVPIERTAPHSVLIAFGFRCNLACTFCMVEDVLGQRPGTDLATFRTFAADLQQTHGIEQIVLSGGEATLEPELLDYIAIARSIPSVRHVRIQTNATRLGAGSLLDDLIAAGADEFFVSVHGADEATTAVISQRPGSFAAIRAGLEAIAASKAALYTNTCTVKHNYQSLKDIVSLVAPLKPAGMDFWNLWPRVDHLTMREQIVPVLDLQPHLLTALDACAAAKIPATVKWFPRCLLGRHAGCQDDSQPTTLIDKDYWDAVPEYACIWEGVCAHARTGCSGLSHAYIETHGWEHAALRPERIGGVQRTGQTDPSESRQEAQSVPTSPAVQKWAAGLKLDVGAELAGWRVERVSGHQSGLRWLLTRDKMQLPVDVRLRDERLPAWQRTAHFDVMHGRVADSLRDEVAKVLPEFLQRLQAATDLPV
jgi:MoaA/NifB/PqqE/SkfB family radical SAM enzyme